MEPHHEATNSLLLQTIFNHVSWSTLHIASRYLQVYAQPVKFDGQGVLSTAKGFAAVNLFCFGVVSSWVEKSNCFGCRDAYADKASSYTVQKSDVDGAEEPSHLHSVDSTLSESASYLCNAQDQNENNANEDEKGQGMQLQQSYGSKESCIQGESHIMHQNSSPSQRRVVLYTLLVAFVTTSRASTNIASSKFTYPYNITLISSLTPIIIAIFDRILLPNSTSFPPLLWPAILLSTLGGFLVAIGQTISSAVHENSHHVIKIRPMDNLIGCLLQLLSAIMSAFARILMKKTEHILTPTHIVQTNNISNCIFPFIYTIIYNPSSWVAFRYLLYTPKSLLAWCTMSIGVYSFASTLQIRLVRKLGPGFYSSWVAIRVLGSMVLSSVILGESIRSWMEWTGIGLMVVTISVYMAETRKWMERRNSTKRYVKYAAGEDSKEDSEEELVSIPKARESKPLLSSIKEQYFM